MSSAAWCPGRAFPLATADSPPGATGANQGWNPPTAIRAAKLCEPHDIFWLEDPMPWFNERHTLARLKAETRVPVSAGETEYSPFGLRTMLAEGLVDYLIIDSTWAGGLTTWRKAAVMAEMYQVPMAAHHDPQIHVHAVAASATGSSSNRSRTRRAIRCGSSCSASARRSSTASWRSRRRRGSRSSCARRRSRSTA